MTSILSVKCIPIYLQETKLEHIKLIETHSEPKFCNLGHLYLHAWISYLGEFLDVMVF